MKASAIKYDKLPANFLSNDELLEYLYDGYPIECTCPKCGKKHMLKMFWTGRGKPRKFCQSCRSNMSSLGGLASDDPVLVPDSFC